MPSIDGRDIFSNQLSNQNKILSLQPTFHIMPSLSKSLLFKIPFYTGELLGLREQQNKLEPQRYLAFIAGTQRVGASVRIFQTSLHWNALLVGSVLWRSTSLRLLGEQNLSQAIIGKPFSVFDCFQKNLLLHLSGWLLIYSGSSKHCILFTGKASSWDSINTNLPALEKKLAFHLSSLAVV